MFWPIFLITLFIDQLTKLLASTYFEISVNSGVSFGWLSRLPSGTATVILVFLAVGIAYLFRKEWQRNKAISGLFWAGVISNLLDRVLLGGVIDWISLPYISIKNNLADFYLSIALILLFIQEYRNRHEY